MLLLTDSQLAERRAAAAGPLAPLADSLAFDLEPLMRSELYLPRSKALLSRAGGRCERDGALLEFDPHSPHEHRCPVCGLSYRGELHHRWWIYFYQLWLAERAVHGALLFLLRGDVRHARLAHDITQRYVEAYDTYPNHDNVLGPTRLFFSTYLESIWLLQLCVAADLLEAAGDRAGATDIRARIVRPSAALIRTYDEGLSNRQVWNNAALLAASLLLGDRDGAEAIVHAPSGVEAHLREGLLADGTWYEGENYHLFAHRGLWYSVAMAEANGISIDAPLLARFREGFATPFATALPDFTLPSRKDSQYAISLQQARFAEQCELGLSRTDDARLIGALARIYATSDASDAILDASAPLGGRRRDSGRSHSTADVERNGPPVPLSRADLGWRSLLHARPHLPPLERMPPRSALLESQGVAVFRRDEGRAYVALDFGQSGGGHGHPDRLNLLFSHGPSRWLDDLGTGSYVDPSLHWYRSSLAHNAPLFDGHSQWRADGRLRAYDERDGVGWVLAEVDDLAPGVRAERAVIVTPDYFIDELRWTADRPVRFELPVHFGGAATLPDAVFEASVLDGGDALEDGFAFARDAESAMVAARSVVTFSSGTPQLAVRGWVSTADASRWFRARAPGQPAAELRRFHLVRCEGTSGIVRALWAWSPRVSSVTFGDDGVDVALGAERHVHRQAPEYWQMELTVGGAASGIELTGWRPGVVPAEHSVPDGRGALPDAGPADSRLLLRRGEELVFDLGEPHYRRSEQTWTEAGEPRARATITAAGDMLAIDVRVAVAAPSFALADAMNPYDNEHPDINGHGVQLYLATPDGSGAWAIVPEQDRPDPRVRRLDGWGDLMLHHTEWRMTADGYALRIELSLGSDAIHGTYPVALDLLVNEKSPERERRRGQLVLSGATGEFVYLRGDRHDRNRLVNVLLVD